MSSASLETLAHDECLALLRAHDVGRVAFLVADAPMIVPVNYRLVETSGRTWIAVRTRPGNELDRAPVMVAFEIDGIDAVHRQGWSVVVRGTLHHVAPDAAGFRERFDPEPWLANERDAWLIIDPYAMSGRRLRPSDRAWAFNGRAYL
jgi:nitroimidazol reductase NimA-like FMN-containing flavoprotein (pyridoxamine 5'-phosphate oxidase superfamily)